MRVVDGVSTTRYCERVLQTYSWSLTLGQLVTFVHKWPSKVRFKYSTRPWDKAI